MFLKTNDKTWFDSLKFHLKTTFSFSMIPPMIKSLIQTLYFLAQVGVSHLECFWCLLPVFYAFYFCSLVLREQTLWFCWHSNAGPPCLAQGSYMWNCQSPWGFLRLQLWYLTVSSAAQGPARGVLSYYSLTPELPLRSYLLPGIREARHNSNSNL